MLVLEQVLDQAWWNDGLVTAKKLGPVFEKENDPAATYPDSEKYQHEINKKENKNYPGDYGVSGKLTSGKGSGRSR